jgi:hypothetical protein
MSTQFAFWRTSKQLDSRKVYDRLLKGKTVRGLDHLSHDQVEAALIAAFPDWKVEVRRTSSHQQTLLEQTDGNGSLDIGYTSQSVTVTCYSTGEEEWNTIIDAMAVLNLPLYDPQINERFDSAQL